MKDIVMSNVNNTPFFSPSEVKSITESLDKKMIQDRKETVLNYLSQPSVDPVPTDVQAYVDDRKRFIAHYLSQPVDPNATIGIISPEERKAFIDSVLGEEPTGDPSELVIDAVTFNGNGDPVAKTLSVGLVSSDRPIVTDKLVSTLDKEAVVDPQLKVWLDDAIFWQVHSPAWQRKNNRVKKMSRKAWKAFENKTMRGGKLTGTVFAARDFSKWFRKTMKHVSVTTGYVRSGYDSDLGNPHKRPERNPLVVGYVPDIKSFIDEKAKDYNGGVQVKTVPLSEEEKAGGFGWGMKVEMSVPYSDKVAALFSEPPGAISIRKVNADE